MTCQGSDGHGSIISSQRGERAGGLEQAPAETSAAGARCIQSAVAGRRYPNLRSLRLFLHRLCLPARRGVGWLRGAGLGAQVSVPVRHPRAACWPRGQVYDGMAPRLYVLQKHAEQVQLTAIPRRGFNTLLSMTEAFGVQSPSPFQMRRAVQFPVAVLHVTPVTHSLCYRFVASDLGSLHARPPSAPAVTRLFPWP